MAKKKQKKKNNDFWKQRAKEREQQGYDISNKSLERIKAEHDRMNAEMHKAVSELIAKYATDNQLTLNQAKQRLSATEKADLMIDLERFKELYGLNNPNYDEMLDRISTRVRISRLDAVNSQLDLMADYLAEQQLNELPNSMAKVYNEQYHKKMFDIQSRSGVGKSFTALSPLSQNVLSEYVGKVRADAFSRNLWGNTNKMVNEWKRTLEVGLSTGANTHTLMKQMSERTDVSYNRTKAMVRTETNYIYNQASADVYVENEVEKYQFISTLDSVTTKICQELDLKEFELDKIEVGENYPPMHYNCRSTTIEVLPDWMKEITGEGTRTARDDNGKTYEVPGDMSYKEWYEKYVENAKAVKIEDYGQTDISESDGQDSLFKHTKNGKLTEEREKLHKRIIDDFFEGVPKADGDQIFTVMGGGPATGKSTLVNKGMIKTKGAVTVDSDAIKAKLPEYQEKVKKGDVLAAGYVHEESSALAKRIMKIGFENGCNVVLDGTGDGNVASLMGKINTAKSHGMKVKGVYATTSIEVALERARARGATTGRIINTRTIEITHQNVSSTMPKCAKYFDTLKLYDTSNEEPILIATGGVGKELKAIKEREKELKLFLDKAK